MPRFVHGSVHPLMRSHLCCEQATGLKEHLNREKATNQELVQQCSSAEQNVKAMEDEVRLVKRQLAIMAKARDVARQEKEDWKSTCNRYDSNLLTLAVSSTSGAT